MGKVILSGAVALSLAAWLAVTAAFLPNWDTGHAESRRLEAVRECYHRHAEREIVVVWAMRRGELPLPVAERELARIKRECLAEVALLK
jgi:hypothetical protein